jgi:hypothetical protein
MKRFILNLAFYDPAIQPIRHARGDSQKSKQSIIGVGTPSNVLMTQQVAQRFISDRGISDILQIKF